MKKQYRKNGYNERTALVYLDRKKPIYSLSTDLENTYKWVDGKPTKEISGYKLGFSQQGVEYFQVKFTEKPIIPEYMSVVQFEGLKAFETQYDVYFKADNVKVVK